MSSMRKDKRCEVKGPRDPETGKRVSYYGASMTASVRLEVLEA